LENYILSEMNVIKLTTSSNRQEYGVNLKAEPNFRLLGARLKGDQKAVTDYLKVSFDFFSRKKFQKFFGGSKEFLKNFFRKISRKHFYKIFLFPVKNKISEDELETFLDDGKIVVLGHELSCEELTVSFTTNKEKDNEDDNQWETATKGKVCFREENL